MKIACIQQVAESLFNREKVVADIDRLLDEAGKGGANLAILPECSYPAYFLGLDEGKKQEALSKTQEILSSVAEKARKYQMYIAMGIAYEENGKLYNAAVMMDDGGKIINKAYKSNLWHFDYKWFEPGTSFEAFDTKYGRMGMMVCADGRIPEIARILKLDGAEIIIDTVNLVAAASDPKQLMNQQYAFILPVRAMENGVWLVASNKCGMEANCASYLGRSMVISPEGQIVADCPPDQETVLFYDIDLEGTADKELNRKPEQYGAIATPTEKLPIYEAIHQNLGTIMDNEVFSSVVGFPAASREEYIEKAKFYIDACEKAEGRLIFLPQCAADVDVTELAKELQGTIKENSVVIAVAGTAQKKAVLFGKDTVYATVSQGNEPEVVKTPLCSLAVLFDDEPYTPELPRVSMLKGCDVLLWSDSAVRPMNMKVAQTRAAENKMFVMRNSNAADDVSQVFNTGGGAATSTFKGAEQAASAVILLCEGKAKNVIPGTNIVLGRKPECYKELTKK